MREILFRGKAINRDNRPYRTNYKNGDWVYGLLESHKNDYASATMINEDGVSNIDIDEETLGQYTGLKDKNGTKIFEGDIVAYTFDDGTTKIDGVVKYGGFNCSCCSGVYGWYIDAGDIRELANGDYTRLVVIGNIHDNPELVEKVVEDDN